MMRGAIPEGLTRWLSGLWTALALLLVLAVPAWALWVSPTAAFRIGCWFDPVLLQFNAVLFGSAVALPLLIAVTYVRSMRAEKLRRLQHDLGERWAGLEPEVRRGLNREFSLFNYIGSVCTAMAVTAIGAGILLFLKPALDASDFAVAAVDGGTCSAVDMQGLDFRRGVPFLIAGPYFGAPGDWQDFHARLMIVLTAFQFGFLGAWVHFVSSLGRAYFTCDLTSSTFVSGCIRMTTASLLALTIAFVPLAAGGRLDVNLGGSAMAVIAFTLGYFPASAINALRRFSANALGRLWSPTPVSSATPLTRLPGVSYAHEVRLEREGIDGVEDLEHQDALELALHTGFRLRQLEHWIGQAWLCARLGPDYGPFVRMTGIATRAELAAIDAEGGELIAAALPPELQHKARMVASLAQAR